MCSSSSPLSHPHCLCLGKDHLPLCPGGLNQLPDSILILFQSLLYQAAVVIFLRCKSHEAVVLNSSVSLCFTEKSKVCEMTLRDPPSTPSSILLSLLELY